MTATPCPGRFRRLRHELETALASLDGWVEDVLAHEAGRFHELSTAWRAQAERIREMDRLLARTEPADREPMPDVTGRAQAIDTAERADSPRESRPAYERFETGPSKT